MPKTFLALILIAIAPASMAATQAKDARLAHKVTYKVELRPIVGLTADLSKMTGITFTAGKSNSDWRVREDCATVIAKDVPLATLMDSITHALKFRWVRSGEAPGWAYRLTEDPNPVAAITNKEEADKQRTADDIRRTWDRAQATAAMSAKDLAGIKESDPWMYLASVTGILQPTLEFFEQVPEAKQAYMSGEEVRIAGCWLSAKGKQALVKAAHAVMRAENRLYTRDQEATDALPAKLAEVEAQIDELTVKVNGQGLAFEIPGVISEGGIPTSDSEFLAIFGRACIKAWDTNRTLRDVVDEIRPQLRATVLKEKQRLQAEKPPLGCDPGTTHSDDLLRSDLLTDKAESETFPGLVASLADASGFAIVTADLRGSSDLSFAKGTSVREALDRIADNWGCNWNKNAKVLEIWSADWHERRESRLPKAWTETMKKKLVGDGTLDLDDLAKFAELTDGQLEQVLQDETLACVSGGLADNVDMLKIYALFTPDQRSALFSESGIYLAQLSPEQQQPIISLFRSEAIPALANLGLEKAGLQFTGTKQKQGKAWAYSISAATKQGPFPGKFELKTPIYEPRRTAP